MSCKVTARISARITLRWRLFSLPHPRAANHNYALVDVQAAASRSVPNKFFYLFPFIFSLFSLPFSIS